MEDLAERLKLGTSAVDEALAIARQAAEALAEAHAHGNGGGPDPRHSRVQFKW